MDQSHSPRSDSAQGGQVPATAGEIRVNNISKSYGAGLFTKTVVQDCSFTIERNKLTVFVNRPAP